MRIALASSGLGHVARGIETWALDTAAALRGLGLDVTLFSGAPLDPDDGMPRDLPAVCLPCRRRTDAVVARLTRAFPGWTWRWGFKSPYGWEQFFFWLRLWPRLRAGRFDILHAQDPMLAFWCMKFRRLGLVRTREILAHGTEESPAFLARFERVQHLSPWHLREAGRARRHWVAIPNFVDTEVFRPSPEARRETRAAQGIAPEALVLGCVAAVKRHHKRIDYLLREFAAFRAGGDRRPGRDAWLLIAGAREADSGELIALGRRLAGDRVRIDLDLPRSRMPGFYRALDVLVLPSLFEMLPICLLEAMASGVPVLVHSHPGLEWIAGVHDPEQPGGWSADLSAPGELCRALAGLKPELLAERGGTARRRAVGWFSRSVVAARYTAFYESLGVGGH